MKLSKVTSNIIASFTSIGSAIVPEQDDKICTSCRLKAIRLHKRFVDQPMEVVEEDLGQAPSFEELEETLSTEVIEEKGYQRMAEILNWIGIQNVGVRELRRNDSRGRLFKQAVDALKHIMQVDCSIYYEDTDVPVVKDIINTYKASSKSVQFKILTLLTPSWSRQKIMDETECSKCTIYFPICISNFT